MRLRMPSDKFVVGLLRFCEGFRRDARGAAALRVYEKCLVVNDQDWQDEVVPGR
jgi:hypothetical protein